MRYQSLDFEISTDECILLSPDAFVATQRNCTSKGKLQSNATHSGIVCRQPC